MVFVGPIARETLKGEDIKGVGIGNRAGNFSRHIVTRNENPAAGLSCKNLQSQVSQLDLPRFLHSFHEFLVIQSSESPSVCRPQRVNTVERNAGAAQAIRKANNVIENPLLIFVGQVDARASQERPARADPDHELSSRPRRFVIGEFLQRPE